MTPPATPTADDIAAWRAFIGRTEVRRQALDVETLRRFAAAVGADLDVERTPPPLAHWAYFFEVVGPDGIGPDGHPKRGGGIMPPVTLPRRMFASSKMGFIEPLTLGREAALTLTVADVKHRKGRSGDLIFVDVDRVLTQDGRERLTELQTIVYRTAGDPLAPIEPVDLPAKAGEEIWRPGPVDLFRYSAVTFNSHRIHYDQAYARDEEGYPDLVVHGPFTALKLATLAAGARPGEPMKTFTFTANAPLFAAQPIRLQPTPLPGQVQAVRCDGAVAMSASAGF